jgi:hypothetical protein
LGKKIPRSIQERVITKWLEGKTRDVVAQELKISGGSVTSIIEGRRSRDREFDLLRVIALQIRERKITVESLALFIRLRELFKTEYVECGVHAVESEKRIDSLVEALIVFCFNRQMTVPEFGNEVDRLNRIADELGIPSIWLPDYARLLVSYVRKVREEINQVISRKKNLLKKYGLTTAVINDIGRHSQYMLGAYYDMKTKVRETEKERDYFKAEFEKLKIERKVQEIEAEKDHGK